MTTIGRVSSYSPLFCRIYETPWFPEVYGVDTGVMPHFGERIRTLREQKRLGQKELADLVGVSRQRISDWERQEQPRMHSSSFHKLASALGVSVDQLNRDADEEVSQARGIPLYNGVPASPPSFVGGEEQFVGRIPPSVTDWMKLVNPRVYAVVVKGDSMAPRYHHGDIVVVDPDYVHGEKGIVTGKVYAIWFTSAHDEGATLKRVYVNADGMFVLRADNNRFEPLIVERSEITKMDLVVGHIRPDPNPAE